MNPDCQSTQSASLTRAAVAVRERIPVGFLLPAVAVCLLALAPLAVTIASAAHGGLEQATRLLFRPLVAQLLTNTLVLSAVSALACAIIGTAAAWLIVRTDLPGRRLWAILAPLPLAIPPFITSYAWLSVNPLFESGFGAAVVVISAYYPLVYLPVSAALRGMDPALEESARTMGCSPRACFFRVTLPHIRPALLSGMLLVTLNVLTEFGAFALLRFRTFTTEIYTEYTAGYAAAEGALLACVLLVLCLLCLFIETRLRGHRQYARIGKGTRRAPCRYPLGKLRYPLLTGIAALATATLGMPLGTIVYWLTQHSAAAVTTTNLSSAAILDATLHSLGYGLVAGLVTTIFALPIAFLSVRYQRRSVTLMENASYLPQGIPGIVVALALVTLSLHLLHPLYQSTFLLIIAYAIIFLPLALVSVRTTFAQMPPNLELAARALGHRPIQVLWRVVIPQAAAGLAAAVALVFIAVTTELTTTLLLVPIGAHTLATQVWAESSTFAFAATARYAVLLVGLSMLATWILSSRFGRTPGAGLENAT